MGEPAHVLPFPKGGKPKRQHARPRQVVLRFPLGTDDTLGGLVPEGVKAMQGALAGMQADRDYAQDTHAGGAIDAVLARARQQLEETQRLVESLVARGLRLKVIGDVLWVGPRNLVDDEVTRLVAENRDRLVAVLGG